MTFRTARFFSRAGAGFCTCLALVCDPTPAAALTIIDGPVFTPTTNAPLAGLIQLTTDIASRLELTVDDGSEIWRRKFYDYTTAHSVPLLGLLPDTTNVVTCTLRDRNGRENTSAPPVIFITAPLPPDYPAAVLLKSEPEKMEPGFTLFRLLNRAFNHPYVTAIDNLGRTVWYSAIPSTEDVRQLANGDLFLPLSTNFVEVNMLGQTIRTWDAPTNFPIDSHDGFPTDHGTLLYLTDVSRVVTNFPTSATNSNAPVQTANVQCNVVVELSATNGDLLRTWSLLDMLDPTRIDYNTFSFHSAMGWDCQHANAVVDDPLDDAILVSLRHQDAVVKFSRDGALKWILGPHENWSAPFQPYLLTPVGQPFFWQYAQHAPILTPGGTVMLYDDGNWRATPFDAFVADSDNYSRAVEYDIDEDSMQVSQVWDYGRTNGERLFTPIVGKVQWLPQRGNVLITYGNTTYVNGAPPNPAAPHAVMARLQEVTHDVNPEVVFDLAYFNFSNSVPYYYLGNFTYRSRRIPDLYPVVTAAGEVCDLIPAAACGTAGRDFGLIASLSAAAAAIGEHNLQAALRRLKTFQILLRFAPLNAATAAQLDERAQGVIDALQAGLSSYATERFTGILPQFEPLHALAELMAQIGNIASRLDPVLIGTLSSALTSVGKHDVGSALRELREFEMLTRFAGLDARAAARFRSEAERVEGFLEPNLRKVRLPVPTLALPAGAAGPG